MASPTPPFGYPPVPAPAPVKRRLLPWQITLITVLGTVFGVLLVLCLAGVVVAAVQGPKSDKPVAASTTQAQALSGRTPSSTAVAATVQPSPTASPTPPPTASPTPTPTPTPTSKGNPPPTTHPANPPTTTTKPAAAPTHAGTITPGAFCKAAEHNWYGFSSKGRKYQCLDNNGWRWEPV